LALIAEYAITPDVFDRSAYTPTELCGVHLQYLKEPLINEGLVRNLHGGNWRKVFEDSSRQWDQRGKELLKHLIRQNRLVDSPKVAAEVPADDAGWCVEGLASNAFQPVAGIITSDATAAPYGGTPKVSSISKLHNAPWWTARGPSVSLGRTLADYTKHLGPVMQHANSLIFIDQYIDPSDRYQFGDFVRILANLKSRAIKPRIEVHRSASYGGGQDRRPRQDEVRQAITPGLTDAAAAAGLTIHVYLWMDMHDRFLITDLIGISLPHGFGTTTAPNAETVWTRLSRADRDRKQREFDPSFRTPVCHFTITGST
jgi:hypothetical protein